jgi:hypothetical protein
MQKGLARITALGIGLGVILAPAISKAADLQLLVNGTFDNSLDGWTPFTTPNGTAGTGLPTVAPFYVTGSGVSNAAEFHVGALSFPPGGSRPPEGAGLYQNFIGPAGVYSLSADVAAYAPNPNFEGGAFSLFFNDRLVDSWDASVNGVMSAAEVRRHRLQANVQAEQGNHSLRIKATRTTMATSIPPVISDENPLGWETPYQYFDNLSATTPSSGGLGSPGNPYPGELSGTEFVFNGISVGAGRIIYIDPEIAVGYNYSVEGGPLFSSVTPPTGINADNSFDLLFASDSSCTSFTQSVEEIFGGKEFIFGSSQKCFSIQGIEVAANLDPTNTLAFETGVSFDRTGVANITMTPIRASVGPPTTSSVPGPLPVLGAAAAFGYSRKLRKRIRLSTPEPPIG